MTHLPQTEKQTGKRIVSKGEYVAVQTSRTLTHVSTLVSYITVAVCVLLAVWSPFLGQGMFGVLLSLFFSVMAFRFANYARLKRRRAAQMEQVVPLSHANIAELPPADTLVRASAASLQEQPNVLLRAAASSQETPADQLLRSSTGDMGTADLPAPDSRVRASEEPLQEPQTVLLRAATEGVERHEEQLVRPSNLL